MATTPGHPRERGTFIADHQFRLSRPRIRSGASSCRCSRTAVSIKNEQFGFPETHYTPILDAVERIEFIRAGAALQFGPQPGGALNFVMKMPRRDAAVSFCDQELLRLG